MSRSSVPSDVPAAPLRQWLAAGRRRRADWVRACLAQHARPPTSAHHPQAVPARPLRLGLDLGLPQGAMLSADAPLAQAVAQAEQLTDQGDPLLAAQAWQDLASLLGEQTPAYLYQRLQAAMSRNTQGWGGSEEENQRCGDRDKHEVLADCHRLLQPALYLEIGVDEGRSLSRARGPALGLDPRPGLTLIAPLHAQARLLTTSSDAFFRDQAERLLQPRPELVFIDGMHLFEFALRDFRNVERFASPTTLVVISDISPCHPSQAERRRRSGAWTGDIWKLHQILRETRPDLTLVALNAYPSGLLLVAGLDPNNRALWHQELALVTRYGHEPPPPPEALERHGAFSSDHPVFERLLATLRQGRDGGWSVAQVREGLSAFRSGSSHKSSSQAPHAMTKTLLYGAFGRHNFGDLLFPWIIEKIFAQYGIAQHLVPCDLLSRDMRSYGGHRVNSIGRYFETQEPLNVISVGGEIGGCPFPLALWFFEPTKDDVDEIQVLREQPGMEYGYLLSKSDFKEPGLFVANSIGGYSDGVLTKYRDYDFIGFRDQPSQQKAREAGLSSAQLVPDCAVLTRYFFEEKIQERGTTDQISRLRSHCGDHYVAVQLKANVVNAKTAPILRTQLQRIQSETGWPIVFFRAGAAPGHDALSAYISYLMDCLPNRSVFLFDGLNVWDICHVIANAHCVIGTSLHVRIISMIYARPRVTLFTSGKVKAFVDKWDNEKTISLAPETLSDCVQQALSNSIPEHDVENTQALIDEYFSKSSWIELF